MASSFGTHKQVLLQLLLKLFDVKLATVEDTPKLKIPSHEKLCEAFEYWIDKTKTLFEEEVLIEKLQSLQDAGVDVAINFPKSKFRIGIQIKSWGDIRNSDFSTKVLAQKSQSMKHNISNLFLCLAGDLTSESQIQKVNFIKSELLQHRDNYVIIISPQKVMTIYNAYTSGEHPLKNVMMEIEDAFFLLKAMKESLTNEMRQVDANLKINYPHDSSNDMNRPHRFNLKIQGGNQLARFPDDLMHLSITDDTIRLGNQYGPLATAVENAESMTTSEVLIWAEKQNRVAIILQTISHEGWPIKSLLQVFDVEKKEKIIYFHSIDTKQPLRLNMEYSFSSNVLNSTFELDHANFDVVHVLRSLIFLQSLSHSAVLRCIDITNNRKFDLSSQTSLIIHGYLVAFYNALVRIQEQTGYKLKLSEADNNEPLLSKLNEAIGLLSIIESKCIGPTSLNLKLKLPTKLARKFLQDFESGVIKGDAYRKLQWFSYYFLQNHIKVNNLLINLGKLEPKTHLKDLLIRGSPDEIEETELEFSGQLQG